MTPPDPLPADAEPAQIQPRRRLRRGVRGGAPGGPGAAAPRPRTPARTPTGTLTLTSTGTGTRQEVTGATR